MGALVRYQSFDLEEAKAAEEGLKGDKDGFLKPEEGQNLYRFVPARPGEKPVVATKQHFISAGILGSKPVIFNCPQAATKRPCLACQKENQLKSTGKDVDFKRSKAFRAKLRVYANVLDRAHPERGLQTFAFGVKVYERLVKFRKVDQIDFVDPENGYDVEIIKKIDKRKPAEGGQNIEYVTDLVRKSTPLGEAYMSLIDTQPDLTRWATIPTHEEMVKKFAGDAGQSDEDLSDDGYTPPSRSGGRKVSISDEIDAVDEDEDNA